MKRKVEFIRDRFNEVCRMCGSSKRFDDFFKIENNRIIAINAIDAIEAKKLNDKLDEIAD